MLIINLNRLLLFIILWMSFMVQQLFELNYLLDTSRQDGIRTWLSMKWDEIHKLRMLSLLSAEGMMASEYQLWHVVFQGMDFWVKSWKENLPLIFHFSNLMKEKQNWCETDCWLDFCHSSANAIFHKENSFTAAKEVSVYY